MHDIVSKTLKASSSDLVRADAVQRAMPSVATSSSSVIASHGHGRPAPGRLTKTDKMREHQPGRIDLGNSQNADLDSYW